MKNVYLSDSGPKVSEAIYGFWRWKDEGNETVAKIETIVHLCLELGINTFDHADIYGDFTIEKYFGEVLKNNSFKREQVVLFSKCGICKSANGFTYYNTSADHITSSVNNSLQRLGTDYLDVFLLDHVDHLSELESTAKALMQLVKQGKIKSIGVSNFSVFQHQQLASYLTVPIVTNHVELNLLNISAIEDGRLDFIKQRYSKPLAWAPLAGGRILNGSDPKSELLRSKLLEIGLKHKANIEQTAVAWLMQLGTLPIIGSLNEERIKNAATAAEIKLSQEEWYELFNLAQLK
ncbi:MAG: aldo/keto reductase [Ferruginibacter sp.]|nr:aldo/keto reductase [Ferruginibacter sp.]